ncbi:hypothetical protein [Chachezhania sediminis]|uniref:hypothetical protein n=1 Tax=Chachezhania sediminis TaxID=2599291 RepID=UPI00131D2E03|nr:hypothetical protein [Chachezhania sediminis]
MQDNVFVIPHDLDVRTTEGVQKDLLMWIAQSKGAVGLDVGDANATQDAAQLLFSAMIEARDRGLPVALGDTAASMAARVRDWGSGQGNPATEPDQNNQEVTG